MNDYYDMSMPPYDYYQYPMYPTMPYPMQPSMPTQPTMPYPMQPSMPTQPTMPYPMMPTVPVPPSPRTEIGIDVPGILPYEQSYVENILRLNLGKMATLYMTYENNKDWNAKIFKGQLEAAGRDHIIISDPETGRRYLLLMVNLDYITFDEPLNYLPPEQQRR